MPVCCNKIGTQTFRRKVNDCNYWLLFCSLENNSLSDQSWWFWLTRKKIRSCFLLTVFSLLSWAGFVKRGVREQKRDRVAHTLRRKRKEKRFWVFSGKEIWHIIRSVIESMIYNGSFYISKTWIMTIHSYSMIGEYLDTIIDPKDHHSMKVFLISSKSTLI